MFGIQKSSNGFNHSTNLLPNIVHTLISSPPRQYPHSPTHTYLILNGSIPHTQTFVRFYLFVKYPSRSGYVGFGGGKRDHRLEENCEREEPDHGEQRRYERQTQRTGAFPNRKWGGVKLQYRAAAHHRDVHDSRPSLHRP